MNLTIVEFHCDDLANLTNLGAFDVQTQTMELLRRQFEEIRLRDNSLDHRIGSVESKTVQIEEFQESFKRHFRREVNASHIYAVQLRFKLAVYRQYTSSWKLRYTGYYLHTDIVLVAHVSRSIFSVTPCRCCTLWYV